jgi:hypothetical protein
MKPGFFFSQDESIKFKKAYENNQSTIFYGKSKQFPLSRIILWSELATKAHIWVANVGLSLTR